MFESRGIGSLNSSLTKKDKMITLLRPPHSLIRTEPPLGIGYIAGYLDKTEFTGMINIIDCEAERLTSDKQIINTLKTRHTAYLGISFFTYDRFAAKRIAGLAKSLGIVTIAGGIHVSSDPEGTLSQCPEFDYGVIGEGEISFYELLKCIIHKERPVGIDGIVWRDKDEIVVNQKRQLIQDLDSLPFPGYHLFPMHLYSSHAVIGSRGCPNVCKFCASPFFWQRKLRFRSPQNLLNEISCLLGKYGQKPVRFKDDTFTCKDSWALEVCSGIVKRGFEMEWDLLARATGLSENVLVAAREAGAYKIRIGVESGNEAVREGINKKLKTEDIYRAVRLARKYGFRSLGTFFMIGLPGETMAEIGQTYEMVRELNAEYISFKPADIYPNTELYTMAVEKGIIQEPFLWFDPAMIKNYPKGYLVYEGVPTFSENFSRNAIQDIAHSLYLDYFSEKLFVNDAEPNEMFFHEMGFMGFNHYKPFKGLFRILLHYFKVQDRKRRWTGIVFAIRLLGKLVREKIEDRFTTKGIVQ